MGHLASCRIRASLLVSFAILAVSVAVPSFAVENLSISLSGRPHELLESGSENALSLMLWNYGNTAAHEICMKAELEDPTWMLGIETGSLSGLDPKQSRTVPMFVRVPRLLAHRTVVMTVTVNTASSVYERTFTLRTRGWRGYYGIIGGSLVLLTILAFVLIYLKIGRDSHTKGEPHHDR